MSSFIRASKYRHVYVEPPKVDQTYKGFRLATVTGEQQYIKANTTFFAVALQGGGGPFAVVKHKDVGEYKAGTPLVAGHKSAVLDLDFNPFHEHVIASASEDSTIKIWGIPADGLTETLTEPLVDLHGHGRKVTLLRFHPTANNVLASVSADMAVKARDGVEIIILRNVAWTFVNIHAIEPTRSRRQRRVDGLKTPRHRADAATETASRRWRGAPEF